MEYLYPGGLPKAMTFSYDDGQVYDRRLVKQFDQMKKMMKQMPGLMGGGKRKGMKGLGGLGGLMGGKMKLPF